ncbi:MAG: GNAT family N-acetyltransferase [Thermoplasmata archaeon]
MKRMQDKVIVRAYEKGDEVGIVELMGDYWKHLTGENALKNWEWEYRQCCEESVITVAEHDGKIMGHYSVLPMKMKCGTGEVLGAKAEGSAIHPSYRGKVGAAFLPEGEKRNLFSILINETFDRAHESGVDLIWGFPNKDALKGQVKAGYVHMVSPMSSLILPISLRKTTSVLLKKLPGISAVRGSPTPWPMPSSKLDTIPVPDISAKSEVRIVEVHDDLSALKGLWERFRNENDCITIERSPDYMKWRTTGNVVLPHRIFTVEKKEEMVGLVAFTVVIHEKTIEGRITDILGLRDHENELNLLMEGVVQSMKKEKIHILTTRITRNETSRLFVRVLSKSGFLELPRIRVDMLVKSYGIPSEFVLSPDNWFITNIFSEGVS